MNIRPLLILPAIALLLANCTKKGCTDSMAINYWSEAEESDGSCIYPTVPETYTFTDDSGNSTVEADFIAHDLQLKAIGMKAYMQSGRTQTLSYYTLYNTWWADESNATLKYKCDYNQIEFIDSLLLNLSHASQTWNVAASDGQAGTATSTTFSDQTYLFDKYGRDLPAMIEYLTLGSVFMYQLQSGFQYTGPIPDDVEYWDRMFWMFGVPTDFPTNNDPSQLFCLGTFANEMNATLDPGCNEKLMKAFIKGRVNTHYGLSTDTPIYDITSTFERLSALRAIAAFETALANYNDTALRLHELSIAYACISALQYATNRHMYLGEQLQLLEDFGSNFYQLTPTQIADFKQRLDNIF